MAAEMQVDRKTLDNWADAHADFFTALKKAETFSQSHWEHKLHNMASDGQGSATALIFAMKNRFKEDWQERYTTERTVHIEHHINEVEQSIESKLARITATGDKVRVLQ